MSDLRFTKEFGSFYLKDERGNIRYMADEVAFLVDRDVGCYLKHGPVEDVNRYFRTMQKKVDEMGANALFSNLQVVSSREWDVDLLNWLLDGSGRIGAWLNKEVPGEPGRR